MFFNAAGGGYSGADIQTVATKKPAAFIISNGYNLR
jgi:hypothetical protein